MKLIENWKCPENYYRYTWVIGIIWGLTIMKVSSLVWWNLILHPLTAIGVFVILDIIDNKSKKMTFKKWLRAKTAGQNWEVLMSLVICGLLFLIIGMNIR